MDRALDASIELALIYHTSPFEFIGRPAHAVSDLYWRTQKVLASLKGND